MRIDDVAQKLNIAKSQIRYYEKIGLLTVPRDDNQYRYFDDATIIDLKMIIDLKTLDIELKDIKYIIELFHMPTTEKCNSDSLTYMAKIIKEKEDELNNQLFILNKLKNIYSLSENNQYSLNKKVILDELNQRRLNDD
ncbi:MerR family transcriptional regulator [Staphylococcus simiae]|uniref:HTH merR-type domain-containing protein n=1 Tax=Staphylococcus simiae CCM 7213 = CCUG 51256 TaxID=911238 RepID=G5JID8_9STAP|nr:MerR family transcriptional regulator [Staphylococcus simiae]EHJ08029.1 hypothetical protein SS7213T_06121 [Staphylococcus simiae CCM 7213 = CCUG 51256]PNZ14550.1 MerR family transcriptional regulator [Staphylococcus simiae]SNV57921.1 transcriptional regulator, MarR family protein [Staphylococcus simiae]